MNDRRSCKESVSCCPALFGLGPPLCTALFQFSSFFFSLSSSSLTFSLVHDSCCWAWKLLLYGPSRSLTPLGLFVAVGVGGNLNATRVLIWLNILWTLNLWFCDYRFSSFFLRALRQNEFVTCWILLFFFSTEFINCKRIFVIYWWSKLSFHSARHGGNVDVWVGSNQYNDGTTQKEMDEKLHAR